MEARAELHNQSGMNVALAAYLCIQEGLSHVAFERIIYAEHKMHVKIGHFNHSKNFLSKFQRNIESVIIRRSFKYLNSVRDSTGAGGIL